jgi:hypothetical protein
MDNFRYTYKCINNRTKLKNVTRSKKGIIGEGYYGTVYNLNGHGGFLSLLPPFKFINKIIIFSQSSKLPIILNNNKLMIEFLDNLHNTKNRIVKVIKKNNSWGETNIFKAEINTNREIANIYGNDKSVYLTNTPIKFKKNNIIGAIFEYNNCILHAIFGERCNNKKDIKLSKLIIDIINSITILDKNNYEHNDIKLDNIIFCKNTYKLIDWGLGHTMISTVPTLKQLSTLSAGTTITTSPIRIYCRGKVYNNLSPADVVMNRAKQQHKKIFNSSLFKKHHKRIKNEYNLVLEKEDNPIKLYEIYKHTFGLYQLGMVILFEVINSNLSYNIYKTIIDHLTSIINPIKDVQFTNQYIRSLL